MTDPNSGFADATPYGSTPSGPTPYGSTPYGSLVDAPEPTRPATVTAAFWLWIGAAALSLVSLIITIVSFDSVRQEALSVVDAQGNSDVLPDGSVDAILNATFGASIAFAVIGLALYVVFAILVRRGMGWARWVLLAFAALSIFGIIGQYGVGAAQFVCLALGTVLVFLPRSREFFAAARAARAARRTV
ncbi:hypothetical protein [Naasia lichenicola]|uniref:Uncharacterized protein n=1 Tax=Naasia lichenicola TaxID=2565933 RepID=A0A4S4FN98_9MICO|nr:hypothetical protein [Naasia lichenicola]THG31694.1 hypothetical protein E6C64_06400 [Naasia lichenicola]